MKIVLEHPQKEDVVLEVDAQTAVNSPALRYKGEIYVFRYNPGGVGLTFEWIPEPEVIG